MDILEQAGAIVEDADRQERKATLNAVLDTWPEAERPYRMGEMFLAVLDNLETHEARVRMLACLAFGMKESEIVTP